MKKSATEDPQNDNRTCILLKTSDHCKLCPFNVIGTLNREF